MTSAAKPTPPARNRDKDRIITWLTWCAILVACMVVIGGYTRLSGSGLSITSWKPIHGIVPPLDAQEWAEEFVAYQQSPQYKKVHMGMSLDEFKDIFWPEYLHRVVGRLIGIVFFIPLVIFAVRKSLSGRLRWQLGGIFALGGLQGLIGWLMVSSGLISDPQVSPWRLALHLSVALLILALILWTRQDIIHTLPPNLKASDRRPMSRYYFWFGLLCFQLVLGSFVAGMHAGLVYNTWPDMNGQFFPDGLFSAGATFVQFIHRNVAVLLTLIYLLWWRFYSAYAKTNHIGDMCDWVAIIVVVQFGFGVATLLKKVPLNLALSHQAIGVLLFAIAVNILWYTAHEHKIVAAKK